MRRKWIFIAPVAILVMLLFTFIGGEIVLRLWNWLLPPLFGFRQISLWRALGLLLLCRILFGGLGRHSYYGRSRFRRRMEALRSHDPRRARTLPTTHARTLPLRPGHRREQGPMRVLRSFPSANPALAQKQLAQPPRILSAKPVYFNN
jgi:hypothetical protein